MYFKYMYNNNNNYNNNTLYRYLSSCHLLSIIFEQKSLLLSISPQGHSECILGNVRPLHSCLSSTNASSHGCHLLMLHTFVKKAQSLS